MATLESLPLELILPIIRNSYATHNNKRITNPSELRNLAIVSPSFRHAAHTILHEHIEFRSLIQAMKWLETRNRVYEVRILSIYDYGSRKGKEDRITPAVAIKIDNVKNLQYLSILQYNPDTPLTVQDGLAFPSLRRLNFHGSSLDATSHLLLSVSDTLTNLHLPHLNPGSDTLFVRAFRRLAHNLVDLTISFDDEIDSSSPSYQLLKDCTRLERLSINTPTLSLVHKLVSHLPNPTLNSLAHTSRTPFFLRAYPNTLFDLQAIVALKNIQGLWEMYLEWYAQDADDCDSRRENPLGDEDGRVGAFVWADRKDLLIEDVNRIWEITHGSECGGSDGSDEDEDEDEEDEDEEGDVDEWESASESASARGVDSDSD